MLEILSLLSLIGALATLFFLSKIDLKHFILPNTLVLTFLCLGLVFHICTAFYFTDLRSMALGAVMGGGILWGIRFVANAIYKDDTLGLGDVKLLAAAGIWLGTDYILIAMIAGALAGLLHGLGFAMYRKMKTNAPLNLKTLSVPAGPGFAVGIIIAAAIMIGPHKEVLLPW